MARASLIVLTALVPALAACGPAIDATQQARTQLVGMPRGELMACAGEPKYSTYKAGKEVLAYARTEKHGGQTFHCEAEIILYRGHVEHVSYDGIERPIWGPSTPCANIVGSCLK